MNNKHPPCQKRACTKDGKAAENTSIALDYCAEYD